MKSAAFSVLAFLFASTMMGGDLVPGDFIQHGQRFPTIADINGDGLDDVVNDRSVLISNGDGSFTEKAFPLRPLESVLTVLDLNGDHIADLLTEELAPSGPPSTIDPTFTPGPRTYRVRLGDAARTYTNAIVVPADIAGFVADVDGDGKDDLVSFKGVVDAGMHILGYDMTVSRSRGDGTFESRPPMRLPSVFDMSIQRLPVADLDHDGIPDMVLRLGNDLAIFHGTGGGAFTMELRYLPGFGPFYMRAPQLVDIDGDSNLDIVMQGARNIRVLFGDGHGKFPRATQVFITQYHPGGMLNTQPVPENYGPHDISIGRFTRGDRNEIAVGTGEGDLVIYNYQNGLLNEVSRTQSDYVDLNMRPGHFRPAAIDDLYAAGNLVPSTSGYRVASALPRLYFGTAQPGTPVIATAATPRGRGRSARPLASATSFEVHAKGECIGEFTEVWSFTRDSIFGTAQTGQTKIQGVFDPEVMYLRIDAPYVTQPALAFLVEIDGVYVGYVPLRTACGETFMSVTATPLLAVK